MDDVTVYQCPECNFNADNLDELDSHITENHSNENHLHTATPSKTAAATANIAVKQQQSVTALIANEVPTRAVSERVDHKQPPQQQQHSPKSSSSSSAASRHNQPVEDDEEDEHRYDDDDEDFFNERNAANNLTTTIKQSNSFREDAQNRFNHIQEDDNYEDGDQMLEDEEDFFQPQQQHHQHHHQQQKPNNQFTGNNGVKPVGIKAQAQAQQQQQPFASRSQPANRSSLGGVAAVGVSLGVLNSDNHYERQYACKQCEFFTNNPRSILYHRKEFHREKINVHECQYCQYASQYSGKVERHTMLRHKIDIANGGTIAPAASSQNNATLVDESAVGDDDIPVDDSPATLAAVAAANVAKFQCNKCPCKYKRSSDLSKHMRLKHGILSSRYSNAYPELAEQHNRSGLNNQNLNGYGDEIENDENDEELYSDNNANNSVTGTPNGHHHNAHHQTNLTGSANRNVMGSGGIASNNNRNFNQLNQKKIVVQSVASPSSSSTSQQQQQQQPKPNSQPNSQPMPRRIAPSAMASASSSSSSSSSANPYQLQCPYCTYTANLSGAGANDAKADYLVHVKDHLCGKAFRCVLCNSVYKYRGDCVVHLKRKHQKADMIAHSYVDKFNLDLLDASEIYSLLKPKQQDEPENEEKLFGCAYCDYKANYKGDVYKHQTRRHPGTMKQVNVLAMHHSFNGANQSLNGSNVLANCSNQSSANNSANNSFNHGINDDLSKYSGNGKFYANNNNRFYNGNSKGQNGGANRAAYQEEYYNEDEENMIGGEEDEMIDYENENGGGVEGEEMMEDEDEINYEGEENFVEGEEAAAPLDDQDEVDEDEEDFFNERQQLQQQQQLMGVNNGADMMSRYQCKFCAFVAKSHAKLKLHLATHYNLKRYMCPICKRRANFKWDIQKHLRKIHNDFTSEVICLSEIEARKSIDTYMETTNANGGRMVNNLNNGQTDAQSDHSSTTTTTTTTTIGANGNMLNEGKSATAALRAPNSNGSSVNYASSSASSIASQQQQQQQRAQYHQQSNANFSMSPSQFGSPNNANSAAFMGSDTTGNKKFRCTICPYRSNWKADLYRHLRKRHGMQQPGIDDVIVLSADEAANTLEEYERIYGVNVRKRARFDAIAAAAAAAATGSTLNPGDEPVGANENFEANESKRMRTTDSSSVISTSTSGSHSSKAAFEPKYMNNGVPQENYMEEEDDYNQADQMENNHLQQHQQLTAKPEETAANGGVERLPVSIAELNIKPYKCLKCGFRSDRKSDTLRHIRVKHELEPLHAFKFLRIMSIKEASETIEEYESTRLFRKSTSRVVSRDYNLINSLVVSQATAQSPVGLNRSSSSNMAQNHMSPKRMSLPTVPQQNLPPIKTTTTKTAPLVSLDYFRCPICLFKHRSRLVMKKHLANHYHSNEINSNPIYQCNLCGFKAGWQFTVKKHIITSHVANPNAAVVRIEPPKKRPIKKNRRRLQRLMMLTSNGATKASNGEVVNNGEEEYYETHENEDATNINGEQIESHPQVVTKTEFNELNESNGGEVYHNNANMSYTAGDINNEVGARKVESIILTDYEGVQFEATYLVSNGPGTGSGGSSLNYSLNGGASVKKKMFYCETCPYKTNNYCNLKQHLLQHRFRDGFFKCRYCPYFVSMIRLLKQHEVLHEDYVPREGPITKPLPSNVVPSLPILQHRPIAASSVYSFPK